MDYVIKVFDKESDELRVQITTSDLFETITKFSDWKDVIVKAYKLTNEDKL